MVRTKQEPQTPKYGNLYHITVNTLTRKKTTLTKAKKEAAIPMVNVKQGFTHPSAGSWFDTPKRKISPITQLYAAPVHAIT